MDEYYCPNCGANLKEQVGYYEYDEDWECTSCGTQLHRDYFFDQYEVVEESTFAEEIGTIIADGLTSYLSIRKELRKEKERILELERQEERLQREREKREQRNLKKQEKQRWKEEHKILNVIKKILIIIVVSVFFATAAVGIGLYLYKQMIPIGYSSNELIGLKYESVVDKLEGVGFENVYEEEREDLSLEEENNEGVVTDVIIGGKREFSASQKVLVSTEITVVYHTLKKAYAPLTNKEAKGMQYREVIDLFEEEGFANIKIKAKDDLIKGWIFKEGEVESVSINGSKEYEEFDCYRTDAEVIITYHMLKN